ncbi:unnamed protein product [Allacma fusca]|uniref:Uncharacterized protein n=1 Tax=Allacma fusca TaxID=39272 RepID=A0A8J2PWD8_9HEXA|nr:unnamed protein product [Allacma fusca]
MVIGAVVPPQFAISYLPSEFQALIAQDPHEIFAASITPADRRNWFPTYHDLAPVNNPDVDPDIPSDSDNPLQNISISPRRASNSSSTPAHNTASSQTTSPHRIPTATMGPTRLLFDKPKFPSQETSSDNIHFFDYYYVLPSTSRRTYAQFCDDILAQMPRDVPDRKSQLLDALSMTPFPNELPTIFALRVRSAAGTEWKSLPEKTAVDSIRSKLDPTVNIFLQSWNDRIRNFAHLLDALREYETCANTTLRTPDPSTLTPAIPSALDQKLDKVLARLEK